MKFYSYQQDSKTKKLFAVVGTTDFGEIYDKYEDEDGFLYLIYSNEKVWG